MIRYLPAVAWIIILAYLLVKHVKVYRLYDRQLKLVRRIEQEGGVEDGSTLVAINQRVRYTIRIGLTVAGLGISVAMVFGLASNHITSSIGFAVAVMAYFYLSEVATGYLTLRDKRVIDRILEIDQHLHEKDDTDGK